ncbi:hypothetical protein [Actinomadura chokoriensis]|uniref:Secreted protein n=1 Tax=Actinomadura chokoriensis TaxID=454156 RepID=A0ABV4R773_9ACTN
MRKITRTALTATAVAATATALTVAPAWAAGSIVTMPGVPSPSIQPLTGENSGSVAATASSGGVLTCVDLGGVKALTATGTVKVGSPTTFPPTSDPIGSVTGLTFSNCKVLNLPATVTPQNLPWSLSTTGSTVSGVTPGQLSGVRVVVNIPSIPCSATFQGSTATNGFINGTHTNPTGGASTLSLPITATNNLIATSVSATCPTNIVKNGDTAKLAGTIKLKGVNSTLHEGPTVIRT